MSFGGIMAPVQAGGLGVADPEMSGREWRPQAVHPARGWGASGQGAYDMSSGGLLAGVPSR